MSTDILTRSSTKVNPVLETVTVDGATYVSARDLHRFLQVTTAYDKWVKQAVEHGFRAGRDYLVTTNHPFGSDHLLTGPRAREVCALQCTELGRRARRYIIKHAGELAERAHREPPSTGEGVSV